MASDYNHLDDVPMSVRQNLAQSSPAFSIITDTHSPEGGVLPRGCTPNTNINGADQDLRGDRCALKHI